MEFGSFLFRIMHLEGRTAILVKNTLVLSVGRLMNVLAGVATAALLARCLGTGGYGKYLLLFAYVSLIVEASGVSIEAILVRDLSKNLKSLGVLVSNAILIKIVGGAVGGAFLLPVIYLTKPDYDLLISGIPASVSIIVSSVIIVYVSIIRASLKLEREISVDLIGKFFFLGISALSLMIIIKEGVLVAITICFLLSEVLRLIIARKLSRALSRPEIRIDGKAVKYLLKQSVPLGLANTIASLYRRLDKILITQLIGFTAVGLYGAAYKFIEIVWIISGIIMTSIYPLLSRDSSAGNRELFQSYRRALVYNGLIGIIITIFILTTGRGLILFLYGKEFEGSVGLLFILSFLSPFILVGNILGHIMVILEKQGIPYITTRVGSLVVQVLLIFLLVPLLDIAGVAYSLIITEGVACCVLFLFIELTFRKRASKEIELGLQK